MMVEKKKKLFDNINKIIDLIEKKKYNDALKNIDKYLNSQIFENNYVQFLKGHVLNRLDNSKEGIKIFNSLLKKDIDNKFKLMILISKGEALTIAKKYTKAIEALDKALIIDKNNHTALEYKARSFKGQKRYDDAIFFFKEAHKISPDCISAIGNMALCYFKKKDYDSAVTNFKIVLKKKPSDYITRGYLYEIYFKKKNYKIAKKYAEEYLKLKKSFFSYAINSEISLLLKEYENSIKYSKEALKYCITCKSYNKKCNHDKIEVMIYQIKSLIELKKLNDAKKLIEEGLKLKKLDKSLSKLKDKIERMK